MACHKSGKSGSLCQKPHFTISRAKPALSLYGDLLSYYPHIKFLGITFDNRMTFTKHFEEILEHSNNKFHRLRILVNKKWGPSPTTVLQIYKQCVRPIFEYGIVSTITVSESVINKIQRVQNFFIRIALRLLKYVSARLLHEASGLPYLRERLITVGQNHLARIHANPLVEHTINSARINIAWDKYKTPISILKPREHTTELFVRKAVLHDILCWKKNLSLLLAGRAKTDKFFNFETCCYNSILSRRFVLDICYFERLERSA